MPKVGNTTGKKKRSPSGWLAEAGRSLGQPEARPGAGREPASWPKPLCHLVFSQAGVRSS